MARPAQGKVRHLAGDAEDLWQPDFERLAVDLNAKDAQTSSAKVVRVYVDTRAVGGDTVQSKVLAGLDLAEPGLPNPIQRVSRSNTR